MKLKPSPHTKTPWHLVPVNLHTDGREVFIIYDQNGERVCELMELKFSRPHGETEANAELIVKAANEHAALVAVAEAAGFYCENMFGHPTPNEKKMMKALAALAAVRKNGE